MSASLARLCQDYVVSVVLGDDIVPRATVGHARRLLIELEEYR